MTQKEWEKKLLKQLKKLPKEEKEKIIEYYREIYGDKLDAGFSNDVILSEFGFPEDCAARILAEESSDGTAPQSPKRKGNRAAVAYAVGMCLLTLMLILPLVAAVIVLLSFGAVSLSGVVVSHAGIVVIIWSAMQFGGAAILAGIGIGITTIGIGAVLFSAFFLLTKYLGIAIAKALKFIYTRRH